MPRALTLGPYCVAATTEAGNTPVVSCPHTQRRLCARCSQTRKRISGRSNTCRER